MLPVLRSQVRGSNGIAFVCDTTKEDSIKRLDYWINQIEQYQSKEVIVPKIIVATKIDLMEKRVLFTKDFQSISQKLSIPFMETSSLNSENVEEAFLILTHMSLKNMFSHLNSFQFLSCNNYFLENSHFLFPLSFFRLLLFSLLSFKFLQKKHSFKIPKFVLFEILKHLPYSPHLYFKEICESIKNSSQQLEEKVEENNSYFGCISF